MLALDSRFTTHDSAYPRSIAEIYNELLFHGPLLQGIIQIDSCSAQGVVATVASAPAPTAWIDQPLRSTWLADPLVLDCAFQLMVLWSYEIQGAASLPCFVGRYRQYRRGFPKDDVRVHVAVTKESPHRALADMAFVDRAGQLIARLEDYECVIDSSLNQAFRRNRLPQPTLSAGH